MLINAEKALQMLETVAREHPARMSACLYIDPERNYATCIVGECLLRWRCALPSPDRGHNGESIDHLVMLHGWYPELFTRRALEILTSAQEHQDDGGEPWGVAVELTVVEVVVGDFDPYDDTTPVLRAPGE